MAKHYQSMSKNQFQESQSFELSSKTKFREITNRVRHPSWYSMHFPGKLAVRPLSGKNRLIGREGYRYFAVKITLWEKGTCMASWK